MKAYITRDVLEVVFGTANIARWADLDGDGNAEKIAERVNFAILTASSYVDTILRGHNYNSVEIDPNIKRLIAQIAGLHLYDAREIIDGDPTSDKLSVVRQQVEDMVGKIRRGEIILRGDRTKSVPAVVPYSGQGQEPSQRPFFCSQDDPFYGRFHP
jgi:hypothetical protein